MSRLRRFFHIGEDAGEKGQPGKGGPPPLPVTPREDITGRFGRLSEPGSEEPVETSQGAPSGRADRFREPQQRIQVADTSDDVQPFVRCAACRADSHRHAITCQACGMRLDTPEQRAFNEDLWARLRGEQREHRERQEREREEQRRRFDEAMAERRLRTAEREAQWQVETYPADVEGRSTPGLWLLRRIPDPQHRMGVVLGMAFLMIVLWAIDGTRPVALVLTLILLGLFVRPRRRRGLRFWR